MEKKKIYHPKLYISISNKSNSVYRLDYLANNFDGKGNRVLEYEIMQSKHIPFDNNILFNLNKRELKNLNIFISRQTKVVKIYEKKHESDRMKVVKNSLDVFLNFRCLFDDWFKNNVKVDC